MDALAEAAGALPTVAGALRALAPKLGPATARPALEAVLAAAAVASTPTRPTPWSRVARALRVRLDPERTRTVLGALAGADDLGAFLSAAWTARVLAPVLASGEQAGAALGPVWRNDIGTRPRATHERPGGAGAWRRPPGDRRAEGGGQAGASSRPSSARSGAPTCQDAIAGQAGATPGSPSDAVPRTNGPKARAALAQAAQALVPALPADRRQGLVRLAQARLADAALVEAAVAWAGVLKAMLRPLVDGDYVGVALAGPTPWRGSPGPSPALTSGTGRRATSALP